MTAAGRRNYPRKQKENMNTKKDRVNWMNVSDAPRRKELKKLARKMRSKGFRVQLNYHGANKWSIDGFNTSGGVWIG